MQGNHLIKKWDDEDTQGNRHPGQEQYKEGIPSSEGHQGESVGGQQGEQQNPKDDRDDNNDAVNEVGTEIAADPGFGEVFPVPDFGKSEGVANNTAAILDSPEEYPHQGDNDD
jgi:hypothetical protein